jgi:hypothetical protein
LGRRSVRKELVALRRKDGGDEGEVAYLTNDVHKAFR